MVIPIVHQRLVFRRRVRVISDMIAPLLPLGSAVLDVGAGSGDIARAICDRRPDLVITGVDVLVRPGTQIPVQQFDGATLPFDDGTFDCAMFVDVLHHARNQERLIAEAARVSRLCVVVKDHLLKGIAASQTLRLMDWVGNRRFGVALPYDYWTRDKWERTFNEAGLVVNDWSERLRLYPFPFSLAFDRNLHFIARLDIQRAER